MARKQASKLAAQPAAPAVPAGPYKHKPDEAKALLAFLDKVEAKAPSPRVILHKNETGALEVHPQHKDMNTGYQLLMNSCGVTDPDLMNLIITQISNLTGNQTLTETDLNQVISVVRAVQPRDELEALLASQMAATQMLTMSRARILMKATEIPQQDSASNAYNKLARTFTTQMAALKHHRTGGEQRVIVQRVDVREGGQAIVGNVTAGGRGHTKTGDQPHALTDARSASMLCAVQEERDQV